MSKRPDLAPRFWRDWQQRWERLLLTVCSIIRQTQRRLLQLLDWKSKSADSPIKCHNSQSNPMLDAKSSKTAYQDSNVESIVSKGPTAVAKIVGGGGRELFVSTIAALALFMVVYLDLELRDAHAKIASAYKDIQTQVWLKQDKEEEKFQKFVAGPYAQLAGELKANEILYQQKCKEN